MNTQPIYETKLHWITYVPQILTLVILGPIGLFIIAMTIQYYSTKGGNIVSYLAILLSLIIVKTLLTSIYNLYWKKRTRIFLNENYISIKTGILSINYNDILLNKIEGFNLNQSEVGRLLDFGNLFISTGGVYQSYLIEKPNLFREKITQLM